jgi:hypothetical protein
MLRRITTVTKSPEASRRLRAPLWRQAVRVLVAAFLLVNAFDWFGTLFAIGVLIVSWTMFLSELLGGRMGLVDTATGVGEVAAVALVLWLVACVVSGDKRTALYLRRFRATGPLARMRQALESGLGRRYRIVTLHDGAFEPLEVPPVERWTNRVVLPLVGLAFVLGSGLFVYLAPLVFLGAPVLFGLVVIAFLLLRFSIRRRSRIAIETPADVERCVERIRRLKGFRVRPALLAPQATVVTVTDELWQEAVTALSGSVDALIVDVGTVTSNLAWELERLEAEGFRRCVVVAESTALDAWPGPGEDPAIDRGRALLADQAVLVYEGRDRADRRTFRRSLERLLDQAVTGLWPEAPPAG